ncbi:MAG: ATPase AAA-2 domain protein [Parcubacteria group bacterium GW2011_GWA1_48_11b]|nr:MAG: ATPase AAA-2 domain protein [Parcubacteria group bacterium GW2011_GWA1_48_11b]KKU97383.1 MAG: ATPase AAA-2 domain protein [Parcubacteria group bacterium GW2011_GWB1_48_6]
MEVYFNEPRLKMTIIGRMAVRLFSYATYGFLTAAAVIFSAGDIPWLKSAGILIALFLLDRARHFRRADRLLVRLPPGRINAAHYLSSAGLSILEWALDRALFNGGNFYLYVAQKLAGRREIRHGLLRMDIKPEKLAEQLESYLQKSSDRKYSRADVDRQVEKLAVAAFERAVKTGSYQIEPKDIFSALSAMGDEELSRIFQSLDLDEEDLENALIFSRFQGVFSRLAKMPASLVGLLGRPYKIRHRIMNRAWTARPTPYLDQFAEDITDLARLEQVGFLIGHEQEYDRLSDVLSRPGRPNVLLVGDPGSGKSTLTAHLAFQIIKDRVPDQLFDKRLVKLDVGGLVAGAEEGDLQNRVKRIIEEIVRAGNIILYIPDIHNLLKTSGQMRMSAADMLIPAIKSSAFSVIGATYPREFKQYIETNNDFVSAFEVVKVQEISENDAVRFLVYESLILERQYKIIISFSAIKQAVELAHKYFRQKLLPASAEDLLKEVLADVAEKKKKILTADDVIAVAEKKVNVPIHKAGKAEAEKLLNLEDLIHRQLVDQEEAVKAVSRALREYRSGLSRKGGPIAAFLFVGPTGVGKTELSKILAKIQFGSSEMMVRLDMSEYQDKGSIMRLIGSSDGSISGSLTSAIMDKPYSLVLLDEFEKAHPDILNLFLQVFDDGRLTDNLGRVANFQNTIIIATSNAHSEFIKSEIEKGQNAKGISEQLKKKLTDYFKPELLNRFSGIIVFGSLLPQDIEAITRFQLKELSATLGESQGIGLQFEEAAVKEIARLGYDPVFGARPLRGVISEKLRSVLAEKILNGEVSRGTTVKVAFDNNFIFKNV